MNILPCQNQINLWQIVKFPVFFLSAKEEWIKRSFPSNEKIFNYSYLGREWKMSEHKAYTKHERHKVAYFMVLQCHYL